MRKLIALFAALSLPAALVGQPAPAQTTHKKKSTRRKTYTRKTTTTRKTTASRTQSSKKGTSSKKKTTQSWRSRQLQPTADRYKEIQQALVQKGYLSGEQTGAWNDQSIDALRRFQRDQNLEPTGKINSLSLIALGLGPKHDTAQAAPHSEPPSAPSPPASN